MKYSNCNDVTCFKYKRQLKEKNENFFFTIKILLHLSRNTGDSLVGPVESSSSRPFERFFSNLFVVRRLFVIWRLLRDFRFLHKYYEIYIRQTVNSICTRGKKFTGGKKK